MNQPSPIQTALEQIRRAEVKLTDSERLAVEESLEDIVRFLGKKVEARSS